MISQMMLNKGSKLMISQMMLWMESMLMISQMMLRRESKMMISQMILRRGLITGSDELRYDFSTFSCVPGESRYD